MTGRRNLSIALAVIAFRCGVGAPADDAPLRDRNNDVAPCVQQWQPVGAGIDYRTLNCTADRNLHLVRLDPKRAELGAVIHSGGTAAGVAQSGGWTLAMNANFFGHEFEPLGEVISGGAELHRMQAVKWESIFYVTARGRAGIVLPETWSGVRKTAEVALQAGPRIVVDGAMMRVKPGLPDWRSGVCIDAQHQVIAFVTPQSSQFTPQQIAAIAASDLRCADAMLFDGGPSAQLFIASTPPVSVEGDKSVPVFFTARQRSVNH